MGVASLLVGLFAGWISVRTTRKLPHERLKQLVDIRQEIGRLDRDHVIEDAIRRELRMLKRLNDAREIGFAHYLVAWLNQHPWRSIASLIVGTVAYFALAQVISVTFDGLPAIIMLGTQTAIIASLMIVLIIGIFAYNREVRRSGSRVEQAGRSIAPTLNRGRGNSRSRVGGPINRQTSGLYRPAR